MKNKIIYSPEKSLLYIQSKFPYLINYGFNFSEAKIRKFGMGWVIDIYSEMYAVRFVLDRGELEVLFSSISTSEMKWFDLYVLAYYLTNRKVTLESIKPEFIGEDIQFEMLSNLLIPYIDRIIALLKTNDIDMDEINKYAKEFIMLVLERRDLI